MTGVGTCGVFIPEGVVVLPGEWRMTGDGTCGVFIPEVVVVLPGGWRMTGDETCGVFIPEGVVVLPGGWRMTGDGTCGVFIPEVVVVLPGGWRMTGDETCGVHRTSHPQTQGNYPKENILHIEHGESWKPRMLHRLPFKTTPVLLSVSKQNLKASLAISPFSVTLHSCYVAQCRGTLTCCWRSTGTGTCSWVLRHVPSRDTIQ